MRTEENERMKKCFKDAILEKKNEKKENRCLMRSKTVKKEKMNIEEKVQKIIKFVISFKNMWLRK